MEPIATPDEITYERAYDAYRHISHSPERRARQVQTEYVSEIESARAALLPLAETDEQRAVLDAELLRYKEGYKKHLYAYLGAMGRTMSSMITGPANFPTRRNEQRLDTERRRLDEMLEWQKKAQAAMRRAVLSARTIAQVEDAAWHELERRTTRSLETIRGLDTGELRGYDRALMVSNMVGRIETAAARGEIEVVRRALALIETYNKEQKKPAVTKRHKVWSLLAACEAAQQRQVVQENGEDVELATFEGGRIVDSPAADRIQIFFDDKPDEAMREKLKRAGWRWAPSAGAWQRQRTENARSSAKQLCGVDS